MLCRMKHQLTFTKPRKDSFIDQIKGWIEVLFPISCLQVLCLVIFSHKKKIKR